MSTPTGYEGYNISELERIAYTDSNLLAQEILARLEYSTLIKSLREESSVREQFCRHATEKPAQHGEKK